MSKLAGGIFSRPSGKTGSLVFGAARTREGKVVTARQFVPPSNPNTPEQQNQRTKFSQSLHITGQLGPDVYQDSFNRSVSQLPGFQSVMSILLKNISDTFSMTAPAPSGINGAPAAEIVNFEYTAQQTTINFIWSTDLPIGGSNNDVANIIFISQDPETPDGEHYVVFNSDFTRVDGSYGGTVPAVDGQWLAGLFFTPTGTGDSSDNLCLWQISV